MFSMKFIKCVVSLIYDSCFLVTGCRSESAKLEIRSVGPPLPETMGLPTGNSDILGGFWPWFNHLRVILSICLLENRVLTISLTLLAVEGTIGMPKGHRISRRKPVSYPL